MLNSLLKLITLLTSEKLGLGNEISFVPSNATPFIFRAVCNLVAVAAFPEQAAEVPPFAGLALVSLESPSNINFLQAVHAVVSNLLLKLRLLSVAKPI